MIFHVDYISKQSIHAVVDKLEKIEANINIVEPFHTAIKQRRKLVTGEFSVTSVYGRWIIIYVEDTRNQDDTRMYFFDFRFDIHSIINNLFPKAMVESILKIQTRYDELFEEKHDTAELTLSELYEVIVQEDLFVCDSDEKVLKKAEILGVLPMITSLKEGDTLKVCFVDEIEKDEYNHVNNIYALIHFGNSNKTNNSDSGFAYIKLRDIQNRTDLIDVFIEKVSQTGVQFDRGIILERFSKARLN